MSSEIAIRVEELSKRYEIYSQPRDRLKQFTLPALHRLFRGEEKQYFQEFWALKDVSFDLKRGESVGIIGRNGSGKSTLLQIICGTLTPTYGKVSTNGRIAALLELGTGFNPEFSGHENVHMNAAVLGLSKDEIDTRYEAILAFADIGNFIAQPVKTYSSGMLVRLAFAVAINVGPDILVIDEALAVGDAAFQRKCMRKINELSDNGVTLLFVSHDLESVRKICGKALYLRDGNIQGFGEAKEICVDFERDLFGATNIADVTSDASGPNSEDSDDADHGSLDPELLNANEKVYGDGRVKILDVAVLNKNRKKINVLESGIDFIVAYRVKFLDSSNCPIFGMMISNREGICVFGTNTEGNSLSSCRYAIGDEVKVEFHLSNNLGPGVYYLTCGVHSCVDSEEIVYLQRRMDVMILKSIMDDGLRIGGMANLFPRINVECRRDHEV